MQLVDHNPGFNGNLAHGASDAGRGLGRIGE